MNILVTGSTGLVGRALVAELTQNGHRVSRLVRGVATDRDRTWDPSTGYLDARAVEGFDAVVHLAGENIAGGRWTPARKRAIVDSRVKGTGLLVQALAGLSVPPKVFISASAIGYYGDRGEENLTEDSAPGRGFLTDTCVAWEAAADPLRARGVRVASLRLGIVLSPRGGALAKMLPPFRLGGAGPLGSGRQWMSWVSLDDVVEMIRFVLDQESLSGPLNATAPTPVTNGQFTDVLAGVLGVPALLPMPAFAARLILGEMADALLLASTRVEPRKLKAAGYAFRHATLDAALRDLLK